MWVKSEVVLHIKGLGTKSSTISRADILLVNQYPRFSNRFRKVPIVLEFPVSKMQIKMTCKAPYGPSTNQGASSESTEMVPKHRMFTFMLVFNGEVAVELVFSGNFNYLVDEYLPVSGRFHIADINSVLWQFGRNSLPSRKTEYRFT